MRLTLALALALALALLWAPRGCFTSDECRDDPEACESGTETGGKSGA